jgi:hypothetical protein
MSNSPTDKELIERYLLGKLTEAEIHDFLVRVEEDREFARKFRLLKTFPEMMSEAGRKELEKKQAETLIQAVKKKSSRFRGRWIITLAAVSLAVLIAILLFFIFHGGDHQKEIVVSKKNMAPKPEVTKSIVIPIPVSTPFPAVSGDSLKHEIQKLQPAEQKPTPPAGGISDHGPIRLLSPADGMKFSRKEMILFKWTMQKDTFTRFFIFSELNNRVVLWRGIRPGIREYKVEPNYLYPGKFYWYIGTKEQMRSFFISE